MRAGTLSLWKPQARETQNMALHGNIKTIYFKLYLSNKEITLTITLRVKTQAISDQMLSYTVRSTLVVSNRGDRQMALLLRNITTEPAAIIKQRTIELKTLKMHLFRVILLFQIS